MVSQRGRIVIAHRSQTDRSCDSVRIVKHQDSYPYLLSTHPYAYLTVDTNPTPHLQTDPARRMDDAARTIGGGL